MLFSGTALHEDRNNNFQSTLFLIGLYVSVIIWLQRGNDIEAMPRGLYERIEALILKMPAVDTIHNTVPLEQGKSIAWS